MNLFRVRRPGTAACLAALLLAALVPGAALVLAALVPLVWTCAFVLAVLLILADIAVVTRPDPFVLRANGLRAPPQQRA